MSDPLERFHPAVRRWFTDSFAGVTPAQAGAWPEIAAGRSTLLLAPTGSGKTLAAFLAAIDRLMFGPGGGDGCRVLYVSPLKALAADVERNLQAPLAGIAATAERLGHAFRRPMVGVRSGDTTQIERGRLARAPPDIYITTPESLYLLLTSQARAGLAGVETVIVDEIHALAASKRGAHLFVSLERLEALRLAEEEGARPLQRIGLSATQRPLEEVARLLAGGARGPTGAWERRPVTIVAPPARKAWELTIAAPAEDVGQPSAERTNQEAARGWAAIVPRLVERIRGQRSTMIFCNSRRLAERIAGAINESAGEELALAHHGSVSRERRQMIEGRLKAGELPALVATSSMELGIDVGAVDLVIQLEAPPSVASGVQRIGRAGHQVGAISRGVLVPKFRGDLLACAAAAPRMVAGEVEATYYPRCPLDILAQQVVATVAIEPTTVDALFAMVTAAAPFAELTRAAFEGVLDMLSGRYPSDDFAELRPRIVWDRERGALRASAGARQLAVVSGGTIPDRGLYGVFLKGEAGRTMRRVGELDEEMVFESRVGDVFLLGASSWRIEEITPDRVLVSPAPGQPGKMPFWRGDAAGRPADFGRAIGALTRELAELEAEEGARRLCEQHWVDPAAARGLIEHVKAQRAATGEVPSDRTIVVERWLDEVGDWRVCVLSPFGARVHAAWMTAALPALRERFGPTVEGLWSDDGLVLRFPEGDRPPDVSALWISPDEIDDRVVERLGETAVFAARFRENAARALLLPRRYPGRRSPLWAQRQRAADLLAVAGRFGSFPIVLETFRECMREVFDLPALRDLLRQIEAREVQVVTVEGTRPSPFARALLFSYVGNFLYEGDAPLAERRAQALTVDVEELRALLGEAPLRELLDLDVIAEVRRAGQRLGRAISGPDGLHELLLAIGDLSAEECGERCGGRESAAAWLAELEAERRVFSWTGPGGPRWAAVEDAGRLQVGLGAPLPRWVPSALREPPIDPLGDLVRRLVRTRGPCAEEDLAGRLGLGVGVTREVLQRLEREGRVISGEFTPGQRGREWCSPDVLRQIRRRSLEKLRRMIEPAPQEAYARLLLQRHGIGARRSGPDALLRAVELLEGAPLLASALEAEVLPARVAGYRVGDLDALCAAGEVVWLGLEAVGATDGRLALYRADQVELLRRPHQAVEGATAASVRDALERRGALFFSDLAQQVGGFEPDLLRALWAMVWAGEVTNDSLAGLRKVVEGSAVERRGAVPSPLFRARRLGPPGSEGRWSLARWGAAGGAPSAAERAAALARALLERHGIVTREGVLAEEVVGGFQAVYDALSAMEEAGRARRGYFVEGLGGAQFAAPGAEDRLRALRERPGGELVVLASTDPANPYGAALPWPEGAGGRLARAAGARVVLQGGALIGLIGKDAQGATICAPESEPARTQAAEAFVRALRSLLSVYQRTLLIKQVDGVGAEQSPWRAVFEAAGFMATSQGFFARWGGRAAGED